MRDWRIKFLVGNSVIHGVKWIRSNKSEDSERPSFMLDLPKRAEKSNRDDLRFSVSYHNNALISVAKKARIAVADELPNPIAVGINLTGKNDSKR